MRVYLAAPFLRPDVFQVADSLACAGHTVTSRWLSEMDTGTTRSDAALRDFEDIRASDAVLVLDDLERWSGRHVEAGYALALDKPVVILGPASNIFYRTICRAADTLEHALAAMAGA